MSLEVVHGGSCSSRVAKGGRNSVLGKVEEKGGKREKREGNAVRLVT